MLLIQATKKLAEQMNIKTTKEQLIENNSLYAWHAHLFIYKRKKYAMVMNNKSRYNFILGSLVKKDFLQFDVLVKHGIKENLMADGFKLQIEKYMEQCNSIHVAPTSDRSIISQINEMISYTKHSWNYDGLEPKDISLDEQNRLNNRFVMLTLPEVYAVESMKSALDQKEN